MAGVVIFLICCIVSPAGAADIEMEGTLGETITLHGVSYVGDSVYLFLTGPGLSANGVTLTDTSQRADQGEFTMVRVNDNQEWTYVWKTSRIANEIDPGTYIVYVSNEPVDKAHLGGTSSYKTLSIFLKDTGTSKVSVDSGKTYTMNPEEHVSTPRPAPSINITSPTTTATSPAIPVTTQPAPVQTTVPTTRASTMPLVVVIALLGGACLFSHLVTRP
jgi:hypothetical protein